MFIFTIIMVGILSLSSCVGTYYLTDSEYSDAREEHASLTYYQGNVYWGWHSGYYYYYGTPHYYPWYYYYNTCPPSIYNYTTHIIIKKTVNRPNYKPNHRPKNNNNRIYIKPNKNHNTNPNKVIINKNRNTNRSNTKVKTNRRPK